MTIKFESRDVWVSWFWDHREDGTHHYVCPVPMIVIHGHDQQPSAVSAAAARHL